MLISDTLYNQPIKYRRYNPLPNFKKPQFSKQVSSIWDNIYFNDVTFRKIIVVSDFFCNKRGYYRYTFRKSIVAGDSDFPEEQHDLERLRLALECGGNHVEDFPQQPQITISGPFPASSWRKIRSSQVFEASDSKTIRWPSIVPQLSI